MPRSSEPVAVRVPRPFAVRRLAAAAGALGLAAVLASGCSSSSASPSSTSTSTAHAAKVTPLEWLTTTARQWNSKLNGDTARVAAAAGSTKETASQFFENLTSKCTQLRDDAQHALDAPGAPTEALQKAWTEMLSTTVTYTSKCLKLAHSSSTADVTAWQDSLTSMNSASSKFNDVANAAVKSTTTTTTHPSG